MDKDKKLKLIGMVCTVAGLAITAIKSSMEDQKLEKMVDKAVQKRLDEKFKE